MTARDRLLGLRRSLAMALVARAVLIGATASLALVAVSRAAGISSTAASVVIALVGIGVTAGLLIPLRALGSLSRVALWVEERTPALRYALVTVADGVQSPALDAQALGVPWWSDARRTLLRSLLWPVVAAAAVAALAIWMPSVAATIEKGRAGIAGNGNPARPVDVLAAIQAAVTPPAYSGRASTRLDDPTSIEALVGSSIGVSGLGDARLVTATADSTRRSVASRGDGWSVALTMPARPAILRLQSAAGKTRLIVLAPIADAVPAVTLLLPARDTIVRKATGTIALRAQLRDDIGLHDADFELVVSSGTGENFTFRTTTIGRRQMSGALDGVLEARLSLDSIALKPGDIMQLRAVARDANNVSGVGLGASETRSLRVARPDEYDSVSVDAAPPPEAEAQVLSQRMILNLTIALERRRPQLSHQVLVEESRRLAVDQRKLRKRVGDVVFQRMGSDPLSEEGGEEGEVGKLTPEQLLARADSATGAASGNVMDVEGDETPILAINKPLLEAFNAMWDAGRALEVGEPAKAIPPMRIALAAIQRARQAERIYLRGRPGTVIVDLAKVRLQGKDKGVESVREARVPVDPATRRRSATFERVTPLLARDPDAAADSLMLMRVDALGDAPSLAAALDAAAQALRKRDSAAIPLAWMRVRRALGGEPVSRAGIGAWQGGGAP